MQNTIISNKLVSTYQNFFYINFFSFLYLCYFAKKILFLRVSKSFHEKFICTTRGFPVYLLLNLVLLFFRSSPRFVYFEELMENLCEPICKSTKYACTILQYVTCQKKSRDYERNRSKMALVCHLQSYGRMRHV